MPRNVDNIHSEEAQEILGKIPSWIIRWGETVIFAVFAIVLAGSCLIKFPKRVSGTVTITTASAPVNAVARTAGKVEAILAENNAKVEEGGIIAVIASNADYGSVLRLEARLDSMKSSSIENEVFEDWIYGVYNLGSLQDAWVDFSSSCLRYKDYIERAVPEKEQSLIRSQLEKQRQHYSQMKKSASILQEDMSYAKADFLRDSVLHVRKLISDSEYEASKRKVLGMENSVVNFNSEITSMELQILQNEQEITRLSIQKDDETLEFRQEISRSHEVLRSSIRAWRESYLIVSPFEGWVSYVQKRDPGQYLQAGETFAAVVPYITKAPVGIVAIPQASFGKVEKGQKVNVMLDGYPYLEYGMLQGEIESISSVPLETADSPSPCYIASLNFPDGMRTTYGKEIRLIQKMEGSAEVITSPRSLFMRLFDPVKAIFRSGI